MDKIPLNHYTLYFVVVAFFLVGNVVDMKSKIDKNDYHDVNHVCCCRCQLSLSLCQTNDNRWLKRCQHNEFSIGKNN